MLSCLVMILSKMEIKNRKSSVGARIVANDFIGRSNSSGPRLWGMWTEKEQQTKKGILEGSA